MHLYGDFAHLILPVLYPLFSTRFSPPLSVFSQRVRCKIAELVHFASHSALCCVSEGIFLLNNGTLAQLD